MADTHLEEKEGIVSSHNPLILTLVVTLIIGLATGAFVLSFRALNDLATASAIDPTIAWIWPLIIDGFIVTATIAAFTLRGRGFKTTWYPWTALVLFAVVSVFGNSIHATNNLAELRVDVWIASLVSAAPAVALLLSSHFLIIMISAPRYIKVSAEEIETNAELKLELFEEPKIQKKSSAIAETIPQTPALPSVPQQVEEKPFIHPAPVVSTPFRETLPLEKSEVKTSDTPSFLAQTPIREKDKTVADAEALIKQAVEYHYDPITRGEIIEKIKSLPMTSGEEINDFYHMGVRDTILAAELAGRLTKEEVDSILFRNENMVDEIPFTETIVETVQHETDSGLNESTSESVPRPVAAQPSESSVVASKPKVSVNDKEFDDWVRGRLEAGLGVTNGDIQEKLGCSLRTAQRRMAGLKERFPELESA